jgi:hypothetical protein
MATVSYNSEVNLAGGYVKVEWPGLSAGDDGQVFNCAGLRLASIHYWGTFNGGHVKVSASNELSPSNFHDFYDNTSPDIKFQLATGLDLLYAGSVRPIAGSGVGNAGVSLLFMTPSAQ